MTDHTAVTVRPVSRTAQALNLFSVDHGEWAWVPRSCIKDEGASADEAIASGRFMPQVEVEIVEWKARELGWD